MRSASSVLHLMLGEALYPSDLAAIESPPRELWLRGREELLGERRRIAIVGTRSPTPYGEAQARRFATAFAEAGIVVVSGMARGIDHAAHRGALDAGGDTIAIVGSGVDRPWPAGELADEIATRGLLGSEYRPGTPPRPGHFPARNRILSGLSCAVLVVEAAAASGSLITARWAADQGRDVFALPGRVDHPMSRGTHRLLREGVALVEDPRELLAALFEDAVPVRSERVTAVSNHPLVAALRGETLTANELAGQLGRDVQSVLTELVSLELAGEVVRAPGGLYRIAVRGG